MSTNIQPTTQMTRPPYAPKFHLGEIVSTPGALEALHEAGQEAREFLKRHLRLE